MISVLNVNEEPNKAEMEMLEERISEAKENGKDSFFLGIGITDAAEKKLEAMGHSVGRFQSLTFADTLITFR